jgi:hypothetical protein
MVFLIYEDRGMIFRIDERRHDVDHIDLTNGETAMKTIISALIALSVLAGIAGQAAAFDTKTFWEQQDRAHS